MPRDPGQALQIVENYLRMRISDGKSVALVIDFAETIAPAVLRGENVLIAAHGNSLRALVKYLDQMSEAAIMELNIPTGIPLVYELEKNLKPIKNYYLGDQEKLKSAMASVAKQGKKSE